MEEVFLSILINSNGRTEMSSMIDTVGVIDNITRFLAWLRAEDRSEATIEKYRRDVERFEDWADGRELTAEAVNSWRDHLLAGGYSPTSVNSMLAAVNTYFRFLGIKIHVRFLRIQKKLFRDEGKELTKEEFERMVFTAERTGKTRLALMLETIGSTGIRVSEVQYITVESLKAGRAQISLKGKIRVILIPKKLCRKLLKYAHRQRITSGAVLVTKHGKPISRKQIWAEMKRLCKKAGVEASKVFPHNLRHLFATIFYRATKDVAKLADLLGHSSIETTRIYLISSGEEHARQLDSLGLVT